MFSRALRFACVMSISVLIATPTLAQEEPFKIGVVNLDVIIAQSPGGKALHAQLETFREETLAQSEELKAKAQATQKEIDQGNGVLPEDTMLALKKQLEDSLINLRRHQEKKQREAQKIRSEGLNDIEKQLNPVFQEFQSEMGYDLILSNRSGLVLMAGERADITGKVLERLK